MHNTQVVNDIKSALLKSLVQLKYDLTPSIQCAVQERHLANVHDSFFVTSHVIKTIDEIEEIRPLNAVWLCWRVLHLCESSFHHRIVT